MSDCEGHGHKAILYKSHFPPLRHSFSQRHHCIHRLINHVYYQRTKLFVIHCPTTVSLHHDARDHVETTSGRPKSVTGKFRMTVSLEILTFSLKPVKFNPGTAGKSTELPALN